MYDYLFLLVISFAHFLTIGIFDNIKFENSPLSFSDSPTKYTVNKYGISNRREDMNKHSQPPEW